jgi:hypothetical protein
MTTFSAATKDIHGYTGAEILTAVTKKSVVFWVYLRAVGEKV